MSGVAGLRGTGDWGTDERPKNFREMILFRNPSGSAPIFALMARVQKESTDDPEFAWWDEPNDIVRLEVNGTLTSSDTSIVVDSSDPSTSAPGTVWGTATHLKPGDLLLVEPTTDNATFDHEIIEVISVDSDTAFTARRGAAGTTAAAITDDDFLFKLGSNYSEGSAAPDSASRNPIKYNNFTQIFKTSYEITKTAAKTRLRTGDPIANEKKRAAFDHSRGIETQILWGVKNEGTGDNGKPLRTFDGLRKFLPSANVDILTSGWDLATVSGNNLLDILSPMFDFDTPAGDTRIVFAGNGALNRFNVAAMRTTNLGSTMINFTGMTKVFGMNFQEFQIPQGRILIKSHPLMNRHALYKNSMFIVDFSALRWRPMRGRDTSFTDNVQAKDEDLIRGFWQTEAGLEVRYGGLTCGYIGGFGTATA